MNSDSTYRRYLVLGVTGAGKSTLAERLAGQLDLAFVELDALYWRPGWQGTPDDEFFAKVDEATGGEGWVLAGNYSRTRPITWPRAQAAIWLDYRFEVCFGRLLGRTVRRAAPREVLWGTNREQFWPHLKLWSSQSLFNWLVRTYRRRKREYPQLFASPEYAHLQVIHFTEPRQAEAWLQGLPRPVNR